MEIIMKVYNYLIKHRKYNHLIHILIWLKLLYKLCSIMYYLIIKNNIKLTIIITIIISLTILIIIIIIKVIRIQ